LIRVFLPESWLRKFEQEAKWQRCFIIEAARPYVGAVVDLRDQQIDKIYRFSKQTTRHDIAIDTAECLGPIGCNLVVTEFLGSSGLTGL
jgi:hypothetical protein